MTRTIYELAGGEATFARIADNFYNTVQQDEVLQPLYPGDWDESKRTLKLFLMQYFGGPGDYSQERGHPRLRMRHALFTIGQAERDAWMKHMTAAIDAENFQPELRALFLDYFERTATFMMNR
jgi:hemoglobin